MENSVDALKLAVSIFVFIIALTMVFALVTKIKDVADRVFFYSDKTNYYTYTEGTKDGTNGRIVGKDTVISAINNRDSETVIIVKQGATITQYIGDNSNQQGMLTGEAGNEEYIEQIFSTKTTGQYKILTDGTTTAIKKGETTTYVIYTLKEENQEG